MQLESNLRKTYKESLNLKLNFPNEKCLMLIVRDLLGRRAKHMHAGYEGLREQEVPKTKTLLQSCLRFEEL
jgi:hypothetical protein